MGIAPGEGTEAPLETFEEESPAVAARSDDGADGGADGGGDSVADGGGDGGADGGAVPSDAEDLSAIAVGDDPEFGDGVGRADEERGL